MAQSVGPVIAIDLGTAYTRVGFFDGEKPIVFSDERGKTDIPSYVAFTNTGVLVGDKALDHAGKDPASTVFDIIHLLGRQFSDPALQADMKLWPFNVVRGQDNKAKVAVQWKGNECQFSPEEICSLILLRMKQIAEFHLKTVVTSAVITVPVNFNHFQRHAIKEAASIASLKVEGLISAPAAAAMLYNLEWTPKSSSVLQMLNRFSGGPEHNILVFDLGAGTLDVSVVSIKEGKCIVLATTGHDHLGGEDFDKLLMAYLIDNILSDKQKKNIGSNIKAIRRLRQACEQAKKILSESSFHQLDISPLYESECFKTTISKGKFNKLTRELVDKCIGTIITCIDEARIDKGAIDAVIPVGAAAKIPMVMSLVKKHFDNKDLVKNNIERAVIYGATIQAYLLSGQKIYRVQNMSLVDASTLSFGIPLRGEMCVMISKNTKLPTSNKKKFLINHYARNIEILVYEGKGFFIQENNFINKINISGHPDPRECELVISFEMDNSGILTVKATDGMCGTDNRVIIGNINHSSPSLEHSRNIIWDAWSYQEEEKMPSNFNVTTSRAECYNPSSNKEEIVKEIGQGSNQSTQPSEPAIGIDLGTTCSCVGVWRRSRVEIIANEYGNRTSVSCVAFTGAGRLIGDAANSQFTMNPTNTIMNVKRLMGTPKLGQNVQNYINTLPFEVKEGPNGRPVIGVQYNGEERLFAPEEITAMMLRRIKEQAEEHTKTEVKDAVITVPSNFNDSQRKATRDAGLIAGLNILQLLNEPTAAAITYYLHKSSLESFDTKNVLVFDLGGGTFDVSVITVSNGKIQVIAVNGDSNLGGEDFDTILVNHFVEQFNTKNVPKDKSVRNNPRSLRRLKAECEKAKRILSTVPKTNIDLDALYEGIDFNVLITKEEFETLIVGLVSRCMEHVNLCLENAKVDKSNIDDVVLIGGSTRIPLLQQTLQKFFNDKELCKSINQDEAVAYGAAVLAAKLSKQDDKKFRGLEIHDVASLSIGIEIGGGGMHLLVPKYSKIPVPVKQLVFYTTEDEISEIPITLFEGVSQKKQFVLSGIPRQPKGSAEICVDLIIDSSGILNLAYNTVASQSNEIVIKEFGSPNLTGGEIEKMINDADKLKADDDKQKQRAEAMNAMENIAFRRFKEMASRSEIEDSKKKEIEDKANKLLNWLESHNNAEIEEINTKKQQLESLFQ